MKKRHHLCLIGFSLLIQPVFSQSTQSTWFGGVREFPGYPGHGNVVVHYVNKDWVADSTDIGIAFESTVAAWNDTEGKAQLLTNGCAVYDDTFGIVPGTEQLNPGEMHQLSCPGSGYISPQGALFLPLGGDTVALVHMAMFTDTKQGLQYGPLYKSLFLKNSTASRYEVIALNDTLVAGSLEPMAVTKHGNGRDWWIVTPLFHKDTMMKVHLHVNGMTEISSQKVQSTFVGCQYPGLHDFSQDGTKYVRYYGSCGAEVMDFGRCSGIFLNNQMVQWDPGRWGGGGTAFYDKNSKLLLTGNTTLYSVDLSKTQLTGDTLYTITSEKAGTTFYDLQYGSGGNIYLTSMSAKPYLHQIVMNNGQFDSIQLQGLYLGQMNSRTLPYYANDTLGYIPGSPCAPSASSELTHNRFSVFPNPATEYIYLKYIESEKLSNVSIFISDISGKELFRKKMRHFYPQEQIQLPLYSAGQYTIELLNAEQKLIFHYQIQVIKGK